MEFYCVYLEDKYTIKKYLNNIHSKSIINYVDIYNKLTKNDVYLSEPNRMVIYSKIYAILNKIILVNKQQQIYYVISELDIDMLKNIKLIVEDLYKNVFTFYLVIKSKESISAEHVSLFSDIKYVI